MEKDGAVKSAEVELTIVHGVLRLVSPIFLLLGVLLLMTSMMWVMMFDEIGSVFDSETWLQFQIIFAYAPVCFLSVLLAWSFFYFRLFVFSMLMLSFAFVHTVVVIYLFIKLFVTG